MFKSLSIRRGSGKYERLGKEASAADAANGPSNEELKRSASVPALASGSPLKMALGSTAGDFNLRRNPTKKANDKNKEKSHPLFSFFDFRRKKKPTARPEFARYIEYVKEGGMWDSNSNEPAMHYK